MNKKLLGIVLAVVLCVSIFGVAVLATAPAVTATFSATDKTVTISGTASNDVFIVIFASSDLFNPINQRAITPTSGSYTYTYPTTALALGDYTVTVTDMNDNSVGNATFTVALPVASSSNLVSSTGTSSIDGNSNATGTTSSETTPPKTGDNSRIYLTIILLMVSASAGVVLAFLQKSRRFKE